MSNGDSDGDKRYLRLACPVLSSFPCTANFSFLPSGRKLEAAAYNEPSHARKRGSLNHRSMCNFLLAVKGEEERKATSLSLFERAHPLFIHCVSTVVHHHARPSYEIVFLVARRGDSATVSRFKAESMFVSSSWWRECRLSSYCFQFIIWPRETFLAGDPVDERRIKERRRIENGERCFPSFGIFTVQSSGKAIVFILCRPEIPGNP